MPPEQLFQQPQTTVPETPAAPPPQSKDKYKLFSAIRPAFRAINHNKDLLGIGIAISVILQVLQQLLTPYYYDPSALNYGQPQIQYWTLLIYIPFTILGILIGIFTTLVIADGAHKEKEKLSAYARMALQRFWRVGATYIYVWFAVMLPAAAVAAIIAAFGVVASLSEIQILEILAVIFATVGAIGVIVWIIAAAIRYSLAGYIAIFESTIPVRHTVRRSRQLLDGTGEWFVLKLGLLLFVIILPVVIVPMVIFISTSSVSNFKTASIIASLVYAPLGAFVTAMLITLYLNRIATKPALDIQPAKSSWKRYGFVGLTLVGIVVLAVSAPSLVRRNNIQRQQRLDQQAAQQKALIENSLTVYTNKANGYALKLPKDFGLSTSNSTEGDVFRTPTGPPPFIIVIKSLPKDPNFVYVSDQATNEAVGSIVGSFDSYLQYSTGSTDTSTVSGDINIPGTRHKRGIFSTVGTPNVAGEEINMRIIIIPKDDGTSLMANITYLKQASHQLDPVIDIIFKSIDLQLK